MARSEWALFHLLERNEETGLSIDNDFFNTADCAGYNRRFACHCFEVDDAKRLVNRWATEHGGVRIKFYDRIPIQHFCDPDDVRSLSCRALHGRFHFAGALRRIARAAA